MAIPRRYSVDDVAAPASLRKLCEDGVLVGGAT